VRWELASLGSPGSRGRARSARRAPRPANAVAPAINSIATSNCDGTGEKSCPPGRSRNAQGARTASKPHRVAAATVIVKIAAPSAAARAISSLSRRGGISRRRKVATAAAAHVPRRAEIALELEIVDSPAAPSIDVDELIVEHAIDQLHTLRGHLARATP
jgi:hypothetical protein